jgi:hypothetical protein
MKPLLPVRTDDVLGNQAGSATEAQIDFKFRGGIVMIKRLILPVATCDSL